MARQDENIIPEINGKALFIGEKPSIGREIASILGIQTSNVKCPTYFENDKYVVTWAIGHLVKLSYPHIYDEKYKAWNLDDLPFLPEEFIYEIERKVKAQYDTVKMLLNRKDIKLIYNCGDSGLEGEYLQRLIYFHAGYNKDARLLRVWTDSLTKEEFIRLVKTAPPNSDYDGYMRAGFERAIEDFLIGINFSRLLTKKYGALLSCFAKEGQEKKPVAISVGRVMTWVLGYVAIREREIRNFKSSKYYGAVLKFPALSSLIAARWKASEDFYEENTRLLFKEDGFRKKEDALAYIERIKKESGGAAVAHIQKGEETEYAPYLFNLTLLQAKCSELFKIRPDETLEIVQILYERKMTTYPRTDAKVLSSAIAKEILNNLKGLSKIEEFKPFTDHIIETEAYKTIAKTRYVDDKKIKDHYAIIPTGRGIEGLMELKEVQQKVYMLIATRFLQIFYPPATYSTLKARFTVADAEFYQSAKKLSQIGFYELSGGTSEKENKDVFEALALLEDGNSYQDIDIDVADKKTAAPQRFTSGNLVTAMENAGKTIEDEDLKAEIKDTGIGTSATRAGILLKLQQIDYIKIDKKTQVVRVTKQGEYIYEIVLATIPVLLNTEMTASWQKGLNMIISGQEDAAIFRRKIEMFIETYCRSLKKENHYQEIQDNIKKLEKYYNKR